MADPIDFSGGISPLPVINFIVAVVCTVLCFKLFLELIENTRPRSGIFAYVFGVVNGVLLVLLANRFAEQYIVSILIPPMLMMLEMKLVSRDRPFAYFYIFSALLSEFACLYSIALCLAGIFFPAGRNNDHVLFAITGTIASLCLVFTINSRHDPKSDLRAMFHSKERGKTMLMAMVLGNIVLCVNAGITMPILLNGREPGRAWELALYVAITLLVILILGYNYIALLTESENESHRQKERKLIANLSNELAFRSHLQKAAMVRYVTNVTRGQVIEGGEYFSREFFEQAGGNYIGMLFEFIKLCVHPDDQKMLFKIGRPGYYEEKLKNDPSYLLNFRISPEQLVKAVNVPAKVKTALLRENKDWMWVQFHCVVTREESSGEIFVYVSLTDIDERILEEETLQAAANTDALTGLLNRSALERHVREYLMEPETAGAFIILDLDYFKQVNDALGHPAGDELLRDVAETLRSVFRDNDCIGRMGGDEFCVFAVGLGDAGLIEQRVLELSRRCRKTHPAPDGREIHTSLSIGVALCPEAGTDYETLYKNADAALYEAKEMGKDTFCLFRPELAR